MTAPDRHSWWTTLPGILTGIAAVITAVVALMGALRLMGVLGSTEGDPSQAQFGNTATPARGATSDATQAPPPVATGVVLPPTPAWVGAISQGLLTMRSVDAAALETGVVGFAIPGQDILAVHSGGRTMNISVLNRSSAFMAPIDATPDKETCRSALTAQRRADFEVDDTAIGKWWCIRTSEGHTGALQVRAVALEEAPKHIVLAFVLWR